MFENATLFSVFILFIVALLLLDLKVFHRHSHEVSMKEAVLWSLFWIGLALLFNVGIYLTEGWQPALNFFTGYLLEKSLSVDNLFVFLLLFSYFKVPRQEIHTVLFWGIIGALFLRALFIMGGIALLDHFHGAVYLFGIFLVFAGVKLALEKDKEIHPENNPLIKILKRFVPITHEYVGNRFFIKEAGKVSATPLFVVLLAVETTDLIFAMDSIPAILAITTDPFIVFTSNIFAILGLRALYFVLEGSMQLFHYLHYGLAFILVFVGFKMVLQDIYPLSILLSLGVILLSLTISVGFSLAYPRR